MVLLRDEMVMTKERKTFKVQLCTNVQINTTISYAFANQIHIISGFNGLLAVIATVRTITNFVKYL